MALLHAAATRITPLLDVDPDLGTLLDADRWASARRDVGVRIVRVQRGIWPVSRLADTDGRHLGLLVVDGLLGREVLVDDVASLELVGPGDVVRLWADAEDAGLLTTEVRWSALADTRMAILDRGVADRLARYPELSAALLERSVMRTRRLGVAQAISQLNRVDRRLLLLMWHLSERWGRVTPGGVVLPLALSHRLLAQLVGARRPTVSTALAQLQRDGELVRRTDGTWLLTGQPAVAPHEATARFVPPRRPALTAEAIAV